MFVGRVRILYLRTGVKMQIQRFAGVDVSGKGRGQGPGAEMPTFNPASNEAQRLALRLSRVGAAGEVHRFNRSEAGNLADEICRQT